MNSSKSNILFSVITIVYNGENYIEKTIKSTVCQTYPHVEYIIIDGLSSDNTLQIINNYSEKITKIVSEKDLGLYDAMNKGLSFCTGDYVIFMNGGDRFCDSNVLEKIYKNIIEVDRDCDFIYGDSYIEDTENIKLFYKKARSHKYLWYGMFTNHQSMVYKLSIIKRNNIQYDLNYRISADYKFTLQFLNCSAKKLYVNFPLCVFALGGVSIVERNKGLIEAEKARKEVLKYSKVKLLSIRLVLYSSRYFADYFTWFYNKLRFT